MYYIQRTTSNHIGWYTELNADNFYVVPADWLLCTCRLADALLLNLWRWLSNPDSALHSPALRQTVRGLMKKMLAQLLATLKKLGARVIAADSGCITLATGKRNLTAAVG